MSDIIKYLEIKKLFSFYLADTEEKFKSMG